jgi:hypothetical protein
MVPVLVGALLIACGGGGPRGAAGAVDEGPGEAVDDGASEVGPLAVEGIRGGIPEHKVERVMEQNQDAVLDCYSDALDDYDFLEGSLDMEIVVDLDGSVYEAYLSAGTLGSLAAESCILGKLERIRFPEPGGGRAEVSHSISLLPPYDPPPMLEWSDAEIAEVAEARADDVQRCLGGRSGVQLTVYVEVGGRVASAGGTGESLELYQAATCLAEAATAWVFPDPGKGKTAKASITF